ncbi:MAG: alpha/beta hydrolase family protein [Planctomycetota bacterium]
MNKLNLFGTQRMSRQWLAHSAHIVLGILFSFVICCNVNSDEPQEVKPAPEKSLPLPGHVFHIENRIAFVIEPPEAAPDTPRRWVWYAPTLPNLPGPEERWMFERFLKAGIAIAGIDVGESYGSPDGRKLFTAFHEHLTTKRNYSRKAVLLGRSRGGLMTLGWAVENPDKVAGFAGVYPVCNIASYPGIPQASGAFRMTPEQLQSKLPEHNPIDRLEQLAKAKVPLFAIHGDVDKVVPLELNSGLVRDRYEKFGGKMQLLVPAGQGHNMWSGFFQSQELVDFVIRCR